MSVFRNDLFAAVGSDLTSSTYLTADGEEMTLQVIVGGSATSLHIHGSNGTGFRTALGEDDWSTLTSLAIGVSSDQMLNIEPGFRWLRCLRTSGVSQAILAGRNVARRS